VRGRTPDSDDGVAPGKSGSDPEVLAPANVRAIAPYVPGKPIAETARELGLDEAAILKMASNENPLGSSPRAIAAIRGALDELAYYPDGSGFELKQAIRRRFGLAPERVVLGNGSNDVLELVARAYLTPADSAVYSQHAFLVYPLVVQAVGARHVEVPARAYGSDLDAMARAIRADTRIVFLANPNNPTGTFNDWVSVRAFVERVPASVLVVMDEAYGEYLPDAHRSPTFSWLERHPNLVVTRTLSKAYGLAGLRIGFAAAHPAVADVMNRVRQPFNVNHLAMVAACAALEDVEFLEKSRAVNAAGLRQLEEGFRRLGLDFIASLGNFVSVRVGDAARVYKALLAKGIIVRPIAGYGLPEHLRVTVGLPEQNARLLEALAQCVAKAPA
jgi:histidinol-phosphate aminotransferase